MPSITFGQPSGGPANAGDNPDDQFAGMGLPAEDTRTELPLGVFDAICTGPKPINSANYTGLALEFTLTDPDYQGEEYALLAAKIESTDDRATAKKKARQWRRIGDALKALGLAVDPSTQAPLDGWQAAAGLHCRLAVNTYNGGGSIVWGRPKAGQFDPELADDYGKFRDYGCGVLPPEGA